MAAFEDVFRQTMPNDMGYDYLGIYYQEKKAQQGVWPTMVFGMSLIFVFLISPRYTKASRCRCGSPAAPELSPVASSVQPSLAE